MNRFKYSVFIVLIFLCGCTKAPKNIEQAVQMDRSKTHISCESIQNYAFDFLSENLDFNLMADYEYYNNYKFSQCRSQLDSMYKLNCESDSQLVSGTPFSAHPSRYERGVFMCKGKETFIKNLLSSSTKVSIDTENAIITILDGTRQEIFKIRPSYILSVRPLEKYDLTAFKLSAPDQLNPDRNSIEWLTTTISASKFKEAFTKSLSAINNSNSINNK